MQFYVDIGLADKTRSCFLMRASAATNDFDGDDKFPVVIGRRVVVAGQIKPPVLDGSHGGVRVSPFLRSDFGGKTVPQHASIVIAMRG